MSKSPPSFVDLGKAARDLFSKGFNYGLCKLEARTKASNGLEFTATGGTNNESKKFTGTLETKHKWSEYGLTFCQKWNTDNLLSTDITVEDQLIKGLTLTFDTQFVPQTGKKSGQIKTEFEHRLIHADFDVDFDFAGPTIVGSAVVGFYGWLAGYQVAIDTSKTAKSLLSESNFALSYAMDNLTLYTAVNDGTEYHGSIFQKVNRNLDTGVLISWTTGTQDTRYAIAAKYRVDKDTTLRGKLNNASQIALSYQQKIRNGVTLTLSTQIEGKSLGQGGHKFGLGLDFDV